MARSADIVMIDGEVLVVDDGFTVAEAVAFADGTVLATGSTQEMRALIGPDTRVVELEGRTVLPGINDSHLHGCGYGASLPPLEIDVSFPAVRSIADIRRAVEEACRREGPGVPIVGNGWDSGYLEECIGTDRMPTRWDLDDISPDNPVFLQDFSRHLSWVNTRWLERAEIRDGAEPPAGGVIFAQPERGITGLFAEGAQDLVQRVLPKLDEERRRASIAATIGDLNSLGITSFTEPGLGSGGFSIMGGAMGTSVLETYIELVRSEAITARLGVLWLPCGMVGSAAETARSLSEVVMPTDVDPRRLALLGAKIFADGIPPNKTSWMHEEYVGGGHGSLCVHGDSHQDRAIELSHMVKLIHDAGLQVGVHVTGDAGIDSVVDAFEAAQAGNPRVDPRHYVIHGDFATSSALTRLAAGGFGINMNPGIKSAISDMMDDIVGAELSAYEWPVRSAVAAGVHVMASPDAPVTRPDWRIGLSAMMLRESKATGRVSGADQTVGLREAVRAYTIEAAWQDRAETWKGSLERGKVADACVLGGSLLSADPHDIPEMPVDMTVFDGQVVFERA